MDIRHTCADIVTGMLLVLFIGSSSGRGASARRADFDAAARLPLEDEGPEP